MSMKKGSTGILGAYVGTAEIKKVFKGTNLIFEKDTGGGGGGGGGGSALFTSSQSSTGAGTVADPFIVASDQIANASVFTVADITDQKYMVIRADCGVNDQSGQDEDAAFNFVKGGSVVDTVTAPQTAVTYFYSCIASVSDVYGFSTTDNPGDMDTTSCRAFIVTAAQSFTITKISDGSSGIGWAKLQIPRADTFPTAIGNKGIMLKFSGNVYRGGSNRAFTGAKCVITTTNAGVTDPTPRQKYTTSLLNTTTAGNGSAHGTETVAGNSVQISFKASNVGSDSFIEFRNNNAYAMNNLTVTVEALTDEFEECSVTSNALTMSTGQWGDDD